MSLQQILTTDKENEKITKEIFAKHADLKVHALHYVNELFVRVILSFQKLLQTCSTYRNNTKTCLGNE